MEALKKQHPGLSIVLTFFSPSGYEVKKGFEGADHIFYLPVDSPGNARRFLDLVRPVCALFVKYEFWYHYLAVLHQRNIPTILISAIFQERHPFFKWYGGLHRKMLGFYRQIFVQQEASRVLLERIGIHQVQIAGDTRFDRAAQVLQQDRSFPSLAVFKGDHQLIVAGSNWQEDNELLEKALHQLPGTYKLLLAPHETDEATLTRIRSLFPGEHCLWTGDESQFPQSRVCIVNTVGQLAYLYKYADVVWIGGGFTRSGIHNIIEPAVFGKPVFFGPVYERYREAVEMIDAGAAVSLDNAGELLHLMQQKNALLQMGSNAKRYVQQQLGATGKIMRYLSEKCLLTSV
jgi:3-deoxy-D-manno-octulosonic-acid transferase